NIVYQPTEESTFNFTPLKKTPNKENKTSEIVPVDPPMPEGLVFKVQIGAFRKPMPENAFNGYKPLSGETSRPGWIRYCLGVFHTYEPAKFLKDYVRKNG